MINCTNSTKNVIMDELSDVPPMFSISHLWPTKERDKLFQTSFISIQPCEQFIARILKVVKILITQGVPANHRLLLINERLNQTMIYYTVKSMGKMSAFVMFNISHHSS